jgi:hypothetical protein
LTSSGLEEEFIRIALADHGINSASMSAKRIARFARMSVLALRANIARKLTGLVHREFCARLADSPMLQKGFMHRELGVDWVVLAHNLWVGGPDGGGRAQAEGNVRRRVARQEASCLSTTEPFCQTMVASWSGRGQTTPPRSGKTSISSKRQRNIVPPTQNNDDKRLACGSCAHFKGLRSKIAVFGTGSNVGHLHTGR